MQLHCIPNCIKSPSGSILRTILLLIGFSAFTLTATAQQNGDGSLYSRFGLGERFHFQSSQIQGMGGGGTALTSLNYVNLGNPATWSDQSLTRIFASVQFQGLQVSDADGDESRLNSSVLQAFQFSFPLRQGKTGVVISYLPLTRMSHNVLGNELSVPDPTVNNPANYLISFEGRGGLQKGSVGLGYRPSRFVSLGGSLDFIFGILQESRVTEFNTGEFYRTSLDNEIRMAGVSATFGAHVSIPSVLRENDALALGMTVSLPNTLNATQTQTNDFFGQGDVDTLGVATKGEFELPTRTSLGLAYYLDGRWTFVADLSIEPWSQFDGNIPLAGFIPGERSIFEDRSRFSAGISFLPSSNLLDSYFKRVGYRLGFYVDSGYIRVAQESEFDTIAFTSGISLPTLFPGTRIDVNFEIGRRGMTDFNLVKETFYKFHVNVNIGERWFERRKLG